VENKLKEKYNVKIINAGISGSTSASAESRLKWQLKNKPDILFLALGANDGLRGLDVNAMRANLEKTIVLAQKEKVRVILAGMKIPMNYGTDYRLKYEAVFHDLAKKHKTVFVPFLLEGVATIRTLNTADGIHPNEKGHEIMAKNIYPVVEKAIKELKAK
jgi:acyl-CoA thioesterase-1